MVHAGLVLLGLGIDNFSTIQGVSQLQLLLGHINKRDRTGILIEIDRDYLELVIGLRKYPLQYPQVTTLVHSSQTWITSIGKFLNRSSCWVETRARQVIPLQRDNNQYIMQLAMDSKINLALIQKCWLQKQVATIVDICNPTGL